MLHAEDFIQIGANGLGNRRSKLAHSLAWFKDHVYLGVTHHRGLGAPDRARILRYSIDSDAWEVVYTSPLIPADERADPEDVLRRARRTRQVEAEVPKYRGFRSMVVFQGRSDPQPALYVSTICHWGAELLRSVDGVNFTVVSEPGLGDDRLLSFRSLTGFQGKLFTAPTGAIEGGKLNRNFAGECMVYVSEDPAKGKWSRAMEPGFGDASDNSISRLMVFNDYLYASAGNPERGFQIWKTDARGTPPYTWQPVLMEGAFRYNLNETAPTMAVFNEGLYISTGLPGLGYDSANDVGPAAAEILRLNPDDTWDLVMGSPRFTPDGLKVPFSAMGPGFDDFYNSVFWSMAVHDDVLYAGSHHWLTFESARSGAYQGGFQVWATEDGESWEPVTLDGFGDPFEIGVRTLLSTPVGLVLGTSNHEEIRTFRRRRGVSSDAEKDAGLEIWLAP